MFKVDEEGGEGGKWEKKNRTSSIESVINAGINFTCTL